MHDRQPRLEQRDQLLVEDQERRHLDAASAAAGAPREREALAPDLEDVAAAALDLGAGEAGVAGEDRLLGDRAVGPSRPDDELRAHGRFSTVFEPAAPFSASPRGSSWASTMRISALFDCSSREAPTTSVWLSVMGMAAR